MPEHPQQNEYATEGDLESEDLRILFDSIDEHLSFWNVLYKEAAAPRDDVQNNLQIDAQYDWQPVPLEPVRTHSDWLKMDSAPLFPSAQAGGALGLVYRLLNMPIKLFGNMQIRFNRRLRDYLHELLLVLSQLNGQDQHNADNIRALNACIQQNAEHFAEHIASLETENADLRQELQELACQVTELRAQIDQARGEPEGRG